MPCSDMLYEHDPILLHRWIEKVDFGEADFWNQTTDDYFNTKGIVQPTTLESDPR